MARRHVPVGLCVPVGLYGKAGLYHVVPLRDLIAGETYTRWPYEIPGRYTHTLGHTLNTKESNSCSYPKFTIITCRWHGRRERTLRRATCIGQEVSVGRSGGATTAPVSPPPPPTRPTEPAEAAAACASIAYGSSTAALDGAAIIYVNERDTVRGNRVCARRSPR
jgi:hypothetical protein